MGNENSTRWRGHTKRRTVEETRRINAREAQHVGAATTTTTMPGGAVRRWCLCPCGARVGFLYQVQETQEWCCRACCSLVYKSAQQRGTRAAFYSWLDQEKWREYADRHPAREWVNTEAMAAYEKWGRSERWETACHEMEQQAAHWTMSDLKAEWKKRNRSRRKSRQIKNSS